MANPRNEARNAYMREWNKTHPPRKRDRSTYNNAWKERVRQMIRDAKNVPCADCGVRYPYYVMQLDHVHGVKKFGIATAIAGTVDLVAIRTEISKCEVVCANCHAERTHQRRQHGQKPENENVEASQLRLALEKP